MDDYIKLSMAVKAFINAEELYDPERRNKRFSLTDVEEILNGVEPADVRPVVRGEWRYKTMTVPGGKGQTYAKWCCSKCKSKFKDRSNFCPNCGAKMGGTDG